MIWDGNFQMIIYLSLYKGITIYFLKVVCYFPVNNEWLKIIDNGKAIDFETILST